MKRNKRNCRGRDKGSGSLRKLTRFHRDSESLSFTGIVDWRK